MLSSKHPAVRGLLFAGLLLCCLFIAWNVPYTHDDWDWGLEKSWALWRSGAMNSRYAGTFFALAMTRSPLIKTLVMGLTMFLLPLLAGCLAARNPVGRGPLACAAGAVLCLTPMVSWRQVFGWVSSFANFTVGALFLLLVLLLWQHAFRPGFPGQGAAALVLFPCCLAAQLFAENLTAALLAASVTAAAYAWRSGRARLPALSSLAGCCLGAWIMFRNALYPELFSSGQALNGIRRLAFSPSDSLPEIFLTVLRRYLTSIQALPGLFEYFPAVTALLALGCLWRLKRRGSSPVLLGAVGLWMGGYSLLCALMMSLLARQPQWVNPFPLLHAAAPVITLALAALIIAGEGPGCRAPRLLLLAAAAGMLLPFGLLLEGGARCAFPSALAVLVCALSLLEDFPWPAPARVLTALVLAAALGLHVRAYALIGHNEAVRTQLLAQAASTGASQVVLPTESSSYYYFWNRNPISEGYADSYRAFYGLPEHIQLIFLPTGSDACWPDIPPEMLAQASRF